ncbi:MAG TPA: FAD-dependent oxidoreductase [Steroidobacteraceae bacterium]|nr:FAD-dependent oxidoreductase [Steroidobacteraceae bacterium]
MWRDPTRMAAELHDVIVVGGGIHGACAAWEAARRGLKVALIEAGDFGQGTSSNSLRTLHGGLRHLQRMDLARMRESTRARREWLRLAPHLTRPMRFLLPTNGHGVRGPGVMRAALWINDLVSADRNRGVREDRHLPPGSVLGPGELQSSCPGLPVTGYNGTAVWYDAVCLNTERLQLAVVRAATACGVQVANYVRALRPTVAEGGICGVRARDELTGCELDLRAPVVINAAGPWVDEWLTEACDRNPTRVFRASKAFNLLTRPLPFRDALGLSVAPRSGTTGGRANTYFIIPWNGFSLVGTRHLRCDHAAHSVRVSREEVLDFIVDLDAVLGGHRLSGSDVYHVYAGLLPEADKTPGPDVTLQRAPHVIDHTNDGMRGLLSIVGVKWTTACDVGARAAALACRLLRRPVQPTRPRILEEGSSPICLTQESQAMPELEPALLAHLDEIYSGNQVIPLLREDPMFMARVVPDMPVVMGQVVYAVREEMALHLRDVIERRLPLYLSNELDHAALLACATVMARELRWSRREMMTEVEEVEAELAAVQRPWARAGSVLDRRLIANES